MAEDLESGSASGGAEDSRFEQDSVDLSRANEEHELEAEEESAAAMDAEVPQPPDSSQNPQGQSA